MIMMVWYASDLRYPQIQAVEIKAMPAKESQNAIVSILSMPASWAMLSPGASLTQNLRYCESGPN